MENTIEKINDLYEEGVSRMFALSILHEEMNDYTRVLEILKELRKIANANILNTITSARNTATGSCVYGGSITSSDPIQP